MKLINKIAIARLMGVTVNTIYIRIKRNPGFLPNPVAKNKREELYDEEKILEWLERLNAKKQPPEENLEPTITFLDIHRGLFDTPSKKRLYKLKKLASKHTKQITTVVHIRDPCDEKNGRPPKKEKVQKA